MYTHLVDAEIDILKSRYIRDEISLDQFEEMVGNWLIWEKLNPLERLEFERYHDDQRWESYQLYPIP